jgi:hypothetical protein
MAQQDTRLEQISNYLADNQLNDVFCTLTYQTTVCKARVDSVNRKIESCKEHLKQTTNTKHDVEAVIRLQMAQLDLISALFMLLEDYLSYSYFLRNAKSQLPEKILGEETVTWKEVDFLDALDPTKTHEYLLLPSVDKFPMLGEHEKEIVKKNLGTLAGDIHDRIRRIVIFFHNHNRVYGKFKHLFPGVVGTYTIQQNENIPRIFVRDRHYNKVTKVTDSAMYVLPNSLEVFDYYDNLKNDISRVFLSLIEAHIQNMQNCGNPFLPLDISSSINQSQWLEIAQKVNLLTTLPNITVRINVEQSRVGDMLKALSENFIFKFDRDPISTKSRYRG